MRFTLIKTQSTGSEVVRAGIRKKKMTKVDLSINVWDALTSQGLTKSVSSGQSFERYQRYSENQSFSSAPDSTASSAEY